MADAMSVESEWRRHLDFPGFAQEFLRRCPEYRRDYDRLMSDRHEDPASREAMARRWGLCFSGRPAP